MPLKKLVFKPGVNRENTRYTTEGGWYESDKVRFRQGTPEKIGGWLRISGATYQGVCRSLWAWTTLGQANLIAVGTNLKFYIESGGAYNDITPIRVTTTINNNPFVATNGSAVITVTATAHGAVDGDFVTFSGAVGLGGNITATVLNAEYQITVITVNTYTFTASATANATDASGSPGGGAVVVAAYQLNVGPAVVVPNVGWGAGAWGSGLWGSGTTNFNSLQLWSQSNFGENLVFGPRGGGIYYWVAASGLGTRGINLSTIGDADCPTVQNFIFISDIFRFVFAFGCDDYSSSIQDPMLLRWGDQESVTVWTPAATNQAGSLRLSHGSRIVTALQSRQEILVWTDSSLYSLQYLGAASGVWGATLLGDSISIVGPHAAALASGVTYWMGVDKFYTYSGQVQTLGCDLRRYVYNDINLAQKEQFFAATNEGFNEVWWFYCSATSVIIDRYVIYNYLEKIWSYGTMNRSAWLDSGLLNYPLAATFLNTTSNNLVYQEYGLDDFTTATGVAIDAYITSSQFDIEDGHTFGFVWRIVPDITFNGSTTNAPQATMTLLPLQNSGSGYNNPLSVGGTNDGTVVQSATYPVEAFTEYLYVRVRGRQMSFKVQSNQIGSTFQLGAPRMDIRADGRR
jgi:hypothetical protein